MLLWWARSCASEKTIASPCGLLLAQQPEPRIGEFLLAAGREMQPVEAIMGPPLAVVGQGETVDEVAARLQDSPAVIVLDGGHPIGILTRSDLLSFLEHT